MRLGIVSNADGMIGERLRARELLQVGPGIGVEVDCVIDSGAVGVMKPDPRIFTLALDAMGVEAGDAWYVGDMPGIDVVGARRAGLRPFLVDPLGLHEQADYERVVSLTDLAQRVARGLTRVCRVGHPGRTGRWTTHAGSRWRRHATRPRRRRARASGSATSSPVAGSDNEVLAAALAHRPPLVGRPGRRSRSTTSCGSPGPRTRRSCPIEAEEWEDDVDAMEESLDDGWEPPPLLAEYQDGRLLLQDGNHRFEALVRAGASHAWTLVYFDDPRDLDEFRAASTLDA